MNLAIRNLKFNVIYIIWRKKCFTNVIHYKFHLSITRSLQQNMYISLEFKEIAWFHAKINSQVTFGQVWKISPNNDISHCIFCKCWQVVTEYYVPTHALNMYILECDDSQANLLENNDWDKAPAPSPWTETLTCSGAGDTSVYSGTRRTTHFKNMLPGVSYHSININATEIEFSCLWLKF